MIFMSGVHEVGKSYFCNLVIKATRSDMSVVVSKKKIAHDKKV